jgi:hypothetical protein
MKNDSEQAPKEKPQKQGRGEEPTADPFLLSRLTWGVALFWSAVFKSHEQIVQSFVTP